MLRTLWLLALVLCLVGPVRAGEARALVLDEPRSSIEVYVHAGWVSFTGHLKKFHSDILIDPAGRKIERVEVDFQLADFKTGLSRRDRDMLLWEENGRFPVVHFRLDGLETGTGGGMVVRGSLQIHGVEHAVSFPVSLLVEDTLYAFDGEVQLDYRDFGLPPIRRFYFLPVDPQLRVRFHLQGRLAVAVAAL